MKVEPKKDVKRKKGRSEVGKDEFEATETSTKRPATRNSQKTDGKKRKAEDEITRAQPSKLAKTDLSKKSGRVDLKDSQTVVSYLVNIYHGD